MKGMVWANLDSIQYLLRVPRGWDQHYWWKFDSKTRNGLAFYLFWIRRPSPASVRGLYDLILHSSQRTRERVTFVNFVVIKMVCLSIYIAVLKGSLLNWSYVLRELFCSKVLLLNVLELKVYSQNWNIICWTLYTVIKPHVVSIN